MSLLKKHRNYYCESVDDGEVIKNHGEIRKQEQILSRKFGAIEPYIRKFSGLMIYQPSIGISQDPWIDFLGGIEPSQKGPALDLVIKELNKIIGRVETTEEEQVLLEDLIILFDSLKIHPNIVRVSKKAFENKMYAEAILNAFKEVIVNVREISGLRELDGATLMEQAFSLNNPKIKLNNLQAQSEKDEQLGFMEIFKGVTLGIRNPKAHENIEQEDPYKTLEYLSLASLLLKRLDERIEPG